MHGAWQVVHGILAFGPGFSLGVEGRATPALGYLLDGGSLVGWKLRPVKPGVLAVVEEGSTMGQGHPDQWLGYLSQCGTAPGTGPALVGGMPLDTPIVVAGRRFTLADLLAQAQHDIRPAQEATWTLMALSAWLPIDAAWTAGDGRRWTTEDVVAMEADADIFSAACGGAHRLYGLAVALAAHRAAGNADSGGWAAASAVLDDAIDRARRFQQADGGFSVHSFERPGSSPDVFAQLSATGHVFEVLAVALDDDQLAEPWVTRAADRLVTLLERTADVDVECGALYHAAHGLALY
ncbi:MAG: ADP-ribosylation factor-directed GTPase activating protein isoform b, partial [Planctomycetia bacterium]|nr:ADP-ribosylation factor-directed GTPase activating protein isoform b [Planctomycetia bacterium]